MKFRSLLIANRGEIALRVMRTAKRMGLATIAVYSDADTNALHVRAADRAVPIGGALPRESYLNSDAIIAAARSSGAQAVHPGYGFLAENPAFAQAVIDAGLVWVGPPPQAMQSMGNKAGAKRLMKAAGVPCIPGYDDVDQADAALTQAAAAIGYPLMIKAAAGGGGRGMRLVTAQADFAAALATARSEAQNAFGSAEVILEKAVIEPRHVEIQVFADTQGNVVHMGERDCSVQRRHQKVIEEAPSPALMSDAGAALRRQMGVMAVNAARAIGYVGAGTIECLLDQDGAFYFMEMNTRLQVEHPVTEALTGFDLVEWQLRVAMGEALPVRDQSEILRRFESGGHAIEVRLCAEDPAQQFLPQSGRVLAWQVPALIAATAYSSVRIETALESGHEVPPFYDSMLAKVIAHGRTRDEARERLAHALDDIVLLGFASNKAFLAACLRNARFAEGAATTGFVAKEGAALLPAVRSGTEACALIATALYAWRAPVDRPHSPLAGRYVLPLRIEIDETNYAVGLKPLVDKGFQATCSEEAHEYWLFGRSATAISLRTSIGIETIHFAFSESRDPLVGEAQWCGRRYVVRDLTLVAAQVVTVDAAEAVVKAPMAGRVVAIHVKQGDAVVKGTPLLGVEAMKMEHTVAARAAGTVGAVLVAPGAQISLGQVLIRLDA